MALTKWPAGMGCATAAAGMRGLQMSPQSLKSSSLQMIDMVIKLHVAYKMINMLGIFQKP